MPRCCLFWLLITFRLEELKRPLLPKEARDILTGVRFLLDNLGMATTDCIGNSVKDIEKIEQPRRLASLQIYIGMVDFLHKFIQKLLLL